MRLLLFGYGNIGKRHSSILRAMAHEVVTVDPDPQAQADYQSAAELPDPWFDAVLDCTPPEVRAGWAFPARARFVEKPLGQVPEGEHPERVMMGFCYRWSLRLEAFVEIIKKYTLYSLSIVGGQHLNEWHGDYKKFKQRYHGVVTDSLPHSLYIARWIMGELEYVGSVAGKLSDLEIEVEDVAGVLLRGANGAPCYLLADYLRSPRSFEIEAITSGGWHRWEFAPKTDVEPMYWRQMEQFCKMVKGDLAAGYPNLADGMAVQRLLEQIEFQADTVRARMR